MNATTARFRISSDVVTRDIDEGLLLVNLQTGKTWKLNHVGAAVCRGIEGGVDVAMIIADLARRYRVGAETLQKDVDALVDDLRAQGLVEAASPK
jgi:hypothetical protein